MQLRNQHSKIAFHVLWTQICASAIECLYYQPYFRRTLELVLKRNLTERRTEMLQKKFITIFCHNLFIFTAPIYLVILPNKDPRPRISVVDRVYEIDYFRAALVCSALASRFVAVLFGRITCL